MTHPDNETLSEQEVLVLLASDGVLPVMLTELWSEVDRD